MSTSQKIGLASVALICLILIGFYLGQEDPRARRELPPAAAIETPLPTAGDGASKVADSRPALVLPAAGNDLPPTGLDAIVSRIKSETDPAANTGSGQAATLASNTPASIAQGAGSPVDRIIPLTEASAAPPATGGAGGAGGAGGSAATGEAGTKPSNPLAATDAGSSATIALDAVKPTADPAITSALSNPAEKSSTDKSNTEKSGEVPSLTLGAGTEKTEVKPYTPVPTFDTKPATTPVKDDPKQFADLAIIDENDPALARIEKSEPDTKAAATESGGANNLLNTPVETGPDLKTPASGDRVTPTVDTPEKTETHAALPVSSSIPFVVPKPDANKPAVKPETPRTEAPKFDTTPAIAGKPYAIKAGDTFSSIANAVYGAEKHWIEIAEANPQVNPSKLKLGQVITLPELPTDLPKADATTSDAAAREAAKSADTKSADATKQPAPKPPDATKAGDLRSLPVKVVGAKFHEVKAGENLATISRKYFSTGEHWRHIYVTNREIIGSDPGRLHVGMKLKITEPVKTVN